MGGGGAGVTALAATASATKGFKTMLRMLSSLTRKRTIIICIVVTPADESRVQINVEIFFEHK